MTRAIVLGGSRGIGKAISDALKTIEIDVFAASKNDIDSGDWYVALGWDEKKAIVQMDSVLGTITEIKEI